MFFYGIKIIKNLRIFLVGGKGIYNIRIFKSDNYEQTIENVYDDNI